MANNYTIAAMVLEKAVEAIQTGAQKHGDTEASFSDIAKAWSMYLDAIRVEPIKAHNVAEMMAILKIIRAVYAAKPDDYVDACGYLALAAMLNPEITFKE